MARDTAQIGDVIDERYRITGVLGTGGMGSVYRAEHVTIRRPVAVKLLHQDLAEDSSFAARFEREAFATGRVDHPNCVTVSDFGKLKDGSLYLVMELLDGVILAEALEKEGRLELRRALHIVRHVLRGLKHAHQSDIVHRDVKPENVILVEHDGDDDFAKILDFGIAKLVGEAVEQDDNNQLTRVGTTVGTPTYVAPEQALGQPVDPRADLYSLSVMLFEMICGKPPFHSADTLKVLSMHVGGKIPRLADAAPELSIPESVEELVRRGLAKDRSDRYADAAEYIEAIDRVLAELSSRPPGPARAASATPLPLGGGAGVASARRLGSAPTGYSTPPGGYVTPPGGYVTPPPGPALSGADQTGTEIIAAPHRWLTRGRLAALGGGALLLIIIAAAIGSGTGQGSGHTDGTALPAPGPVTRSVLPSGPSELSEKAKKFLEQENPRAAIALLEKRADEIAYDGHGQLELGHAYAAVDRKLDAVKAYQRALQIDSELTDDAELRANIRAIYQSRRAGDDARSAALELAVLYLQDEEAQKRLVEVASGARSLTERQNARDLAERAGVLDKVDLVESYALDLRQEETCEKRKPFVAKLRALDDKRAIRPLRRALYRKRGGLLGIGGRRVNNCLRDEAKAAIEYLKAL